MADQEKTDVQTDSSSDMAALTTKVGEMTVEEVRVEDTHTLAQPLTSLGHVYGHLQSHGNHDDSSDAATVEQAKVVDIKRDDRSHTVALGKKMRGIRFNTRRGRGRGNGNKVKRVLTDDEKVEKAERDRLVDMVVDFFKTHYDKDNLACWQAISRDLGVKIGATIAECKQTLKVVFINIFDFVDACSEDKLPNYFDAELPLALYIRQTGKRFPLRKAKKIPILRWMLIKVD